MPVPFCVKPPGPLITPPIVRFPDWIACSVAPLALRLTLILEVDPSASSRARLALLETVTLLAVKLPVVPLPICKMPPVTVVAPE